MDLSSQGRRRLTAAPTADHAPHQVAGPAVARAHACRFAGLSWRSRNASPCGSTWRGMLLLQSPVARRLARVGPAPAGAGDGGSRGDESVGWLLALRCAPRVRGPRGGAARARRGGQVIGRRVMGRRVTAPSDRRRADRRSPQLTSKACGARLSVSEGGRHVARREDDKCAFIRERESCARKPNSFAQPSTYHTSAPRQYEPHLFTKCKPAHPWQHPGSPTRKRRP